MSSGLPSAQAFLEDKIVTFFSIDRDVIHALVLSSTLKFELKVPEW